jgi:arylsulfatase A-like enzyme
MLIGKYPSETHRGWRHFNKFTEEDTFVQERLQKQGIHTVSVQAHWYFQGDTGLGRGFDVLDMSAKPEEQPVEGDKTVTSDKISDAAIAQLERLSGEKRQFFMWVHYLDPHADYVKHEEFHFGRWQRDLYEGEIAYTDHHVGRVLEKLGELPLAKNTIVILTSDHGEAFGEHGLIRHGFELWEELVRVPFIVHVPGVEPRRHQVRRSAIDIVPTLLDIYGTPSPSGQGDDFISGRSLLKDVLMPAGHEPKPRVIFMDMSAGPYNDERQAFIENDVKLIAAWGRPIGIYDLEKDPGETKDLKKDAVIREKYAERYSAFRAQLRTVFVEKPK